VFDDKNDDDENEWNLATPEAPCIVSEPAIPIPAASSPQTITSSALRLRFQKGPEIENEKRPLQGS